MGQRDLSGRLARWALKLQGMNFSIEHRTGKDNVVADALSRTPEFEDINEIVTEVLPIIDLDDKEFNSVEYQNLITNVQKSGLLDLKVIDKHLYYLADFDQGHDEISSSWKLLVPKGLRNKVIYAAHNPPNAAHGGISKTLNRVRRYFYWQGMVTDTRQYVKNFELCQTSKVPNYTLRPPMGIAGESCRPFETLYIDLIGQFPRSRNGNIGILIILDHFSKFTF